MMWRVDEIGVREVVKNGRWRIGTLGRFGRLDGGRTQKRDFLGEELGLGSGVALRGR
jgi:hypothetical protein